MKVFSINEIDVHKIEYANPKASSFGGQAIQITYDGKPLIVQTPQCQLPNGISTFTFGDGDAKLSLDLELTRDTDSTARCISFLEQFDKWNVETAVGNCDKWFRKELELESVQKLYRQQLYKHSKKFKAKLPTKQGEYVGHVFDAAKNPLKLDSITDGCYVECILECIGMYFNSDGFGVTWKAIQVMVHQPKRESNEYAFISDDEEA